MATKPKVTKTNLPAKWEEELAKQADMAAKAEANAGGGGKFFSTRGGMLSFDDAPLPNNQMAVIIVDTIFENTYYEGVYDPDAPASPLCFAFGRDEDDMVPHVIVTDAGNEQAADCGQCPMNEWGSADVGKGKACKNTRRLAMIPAGQFDRQGQFEMIEDIEHFETVDFGFMKLPVTSIKGYANFVKQVAGTLRRPPHGIVTKVRIVPDAKTQFKVVFEPMMNVPDEIMGAVMKRNEEAKTVIDFPYTPFEETEAPQKQSRRAPQKQGRQAPAKKVPASKAPAKRGKY
jgi:hypothetical protein